MSKGIGQKIAIKFTEKLMGDVTGITPTPIGGIAYIKPLGIPTASSQYSSYGPGNAFDGSTSNYWYTRTSDPQWIQMELYAPNRSNGFRWYVSSYRPNGFYVEASNDGISWDKLFTGNSPDSAGWQEFSWEVTEPYKYFRWTITSRYSSYLYIYDIALSVPAGNEQAFTLSGQEYQYINGPTVNKTYEIIEVETHPDHTDDKHLLLTIHPQRRFNNVIGNLTLTYDHTKGNLRGRGSFVESFSEIFLPTDLVPFPSPNDEQGIIVLTPTLDVNFKRIYYQNRYETETIIVTPSCTLDFIHINDINP